jgi:tryptophan synthase alpha chain
MCGLNLIMLVTPTTPPSRAARIVKLSSGFVYCVSVAGITGERERLPDELLVQLRQLRGMTDLPLCVGFGVSRPEHVQMLREEVDGVIVGSAIVRRLENATAANWAAATTEIRELVRSLLDALNPPGR